MSKDPFNPFDPFDPLETEATSFMRPTPGGRAGERGTGAPRPEDRPRRDSAAAFTIDAGPPADSPLDAALPLLLAACRCRQTTGGATLAEIQKGFTLALKDYAATVRRLVPDPALARKIHYLVCATIDDLLQNTKWGVEGSWDASGMVVTYHKEAVGGKHFYTITQGLLRAATASPAALYVAHACLAVGFLGEWRHEDNGRQDAADLRAKIQTVLRHLSPPADPALSPRWLGSPVPAPDLHRGVPVWVGFVAGLALLLALFVLLQSLLAAESEKVRVKLESLRPPVVQAAAPPPAPLPPPPDRRLAPALAQCLTNVGDPAQVMESVDRLFVRMDLFDSGAADVADRYRPHLRCVADAMRDASGPVQVHGHTDSQRPRSLRFATNFDLAEARAMAVARVLAELSGDGNHIRAFGHGDGSPVDSNETEAGRRLNRRVEFILLKDGSR